MRTDRLHTTLQLRAIFYAKMKEIQKKQQHYQCH